MTDFRIIVLSRGYKYFYKCTHKSRSSDGALLSSLLDGCTTPHIPGIHPIKTTRCGLIKFQVAKTGSPSAKKEDTQSWRGAQKAAGALLMFPGENGTLK